MAAAAARGTRAAVLMRATWATRATEGTARTARASRAAATRPVWIRERSIVFGVFGREGLHRRESKGRHLKSKSRAGAAQRILRTPPPPRAIGGNLSGPRGINPIVPAVWRAVVRVLVATTIYARIPVYARLIKRMCASTSHACEERLSRMYWCECSGWHVVEFESVHAARRIVSASNRAEPFRRSMDGADLCSPVLHISEVLPETDHLDLGEL